MIVTCKNCGIELFEQEKDKAVKIFRSFATRKDDEGHTYYLCINCHENAGVPMIAIGSFGVRDEELTLKHPENPSTVFEITD